MAASSSSSSSSSSMKHDVDERFIESAILESNLDKLKKDFKRVYEQITAARSKYNEFFRIEAFKRFWFPMYKDDGEKPEFMVHHGEVASGFVTSYKKTFIPINRSEHGWNIDFWSLIEKHYNQTKSIQESIVSLEIQLLKLQNRSCKNVFYSHPESLHDEFDHEDGHQHAIHKRIDFRLKSLSNIIKTLSENIVNDMIQFYSFAHYLYMTYHKKLKAEEQIRDDTHSIIDDKYKVGDLRKPSLVSNPDDDDVQILRYHLIVNLIKHRIKIRNSQHPFETTLRYIDMHSRKDSKYQENADKCHFDKIYAFSVHEYIRHLNFIDSSSGDDFVGFSDYEKKNLVAFLSTFPEFVNVESFFKVYTGSSSNYAYYAPQQLLLNTFSNAMRLSEQNQKQWAGQVFKSSKEYLTYQNQSYDFMSAMYDYYVNLEYMISLAAKVSHNQKTQFGFRYLESFFNAMFLKHDIMFLLPTANFTSFEFPSLDSKTSVFPSTMSKSLQKITSVDLGVREYDSLNSTVIGFYESGEFHPMIMKDKSDGSFSVTANPDDLSFSNVFTDISFSIDYNPISGLLN